MKIGQAALTTIAAVSSPVKMMALDSCSSNTYQTKISKLATKIKTQVLVSARGSGSNGELGTPSFYIIDKLPVEFHNNLSTKLEANDLDIGENRKAFYIDSVLTHDEADVLAACAEAILEDNGHSRLAPGIHTPPGMRINEAAHWYPSQTLAPNFLGKIYDRIRHLVPDKLNGLRLYSRFSEKVAQFKYSRGDKFNRHIDGLFPGQGANQEGTGVEEWIGVVSGFSMIFYLNDKETDGLVGGETRLWTSDGSRYVDVSPKKGRVLIFRRGSRDAVLHAGLSVSGEVPKYMALINLVYGEKTGSKRLI